MIWNLKIGIGMWGKFLIVMVFILISGCCFVTFYTRKAALAAQNALHNIKTFNGVSTIEFIFVYKRVCVCENILSVCEVCLKVWWDVLDIDKLWLTIFPQFLIDESSMWSYTVAKKKIPIHKIFILYLIFILFN